jgi:hypothetical protein
MLGDLGVSTLHSINTNISSRLRRRQLRQVARPPSTPVSPLANLPGGSVVVGLRSADLSVFPSSSSSGRRTSLRLHCRLRQVARPFGKSVTVFLSFLFWIIIRDIVVSIYWKSASYRSSLDLSSFDKTTNMSTAKLICFSFFLDRRARYSTCR